MVRANPNNTELDAGLGFEHKEAPKPEMDSFDRNLRFVIRAVGIVIVLIVVSITSCTMHSNKFDEARMKQETEQARAQNESRQAEIA